MGQILSLETITGKLKVSLAVHPVILIKLLLTVHSRLTNLEISVLMLILFKKTIAGNIKSSLKIKGTIIG